MKIIGVLLFCILLMGCTSTKPAGDNKPYVEATEKEHSFEHIEGLSKNLEELISSPRFRMPVLKGGQDALQKAVNKITRRNYCPVRGRVSVSYVVDEKGKIMAAQTVLGIHEACDSIAEKAVSKISYEPARYNGEPIKLRMSNSIEFR
jgi:hypothetical protein